MHPKTSCASSISNWLNCNLEDWMTIIVPAYQLRIVRQGLRGGPNEKANLRDQYDPGWLR
jgi:hypothetical protein